MAFSSISKFDGRTMRFLAPNELAQIAGRAGRGMSDGSFGETGEVAALEEDVVKAIVEHRFKPLKKLMWRNSELSFASIETLIQALDKKTESDVLVKAREADDFTALKSLSQSPDLQIRIDDKSSVKLLWDVCRIPDFRGISSVEPVSYTHLTLPTKA